MQDERTEGKPLVDDAALWKRNRELEIEDYTVPETPPAGFIDVDAQTEDSAGEDEPRHVTATDVRDNLNSLKLAQPTAGLCVSLMDIILPALACWLSGADKGMFKLEPDERDALQDAFANYLKETNFNLSPGGILIMTIAGIYVPKIMIVTMMKRKEEKQHGGETAA